MATLVLLGVQVTVTPAAAADGCTVMLCLAGNWRNIAECVGPVREAMRDALRGKWPTCQEADADNNAGMADPPCPMQYRIPVYETASVENEFGCRFSRVVENRIDGVLWTRTWWNEDGDSVTEWLPAAKAGLSADEMDDRFDSDYAAWVEADDARRSNQPVNTGDSGG